MAGHDSSMKAIFYAFLANFGIAVFKGGAAIYTGSGSMLAEAIHSLADCSNQILLYFGLKRSLKPATADHPFGYGKVIYFWSFIVAILLFSMGGLFSIYEGTHKIYHPESLKDAWVALVVLALSIVLETFSLLGAVREIRKTNGKKTLFEWVKGSRQAEMVVILGEDIAALIGLVIAFIFVFMAYITGNPVFDALGSISIGVILILISVFLVVKIKSLIIGRSADPELAELINKEIASDPVVEKVFNLVTVQFGPSIMLAARVKIKSGIEIDKVCHLLNAIQEKVHIKYPEVKWFFIEPDLK